MEMVRSVYMMLTEAHVLLLQNIVPASKAKTDMYLDNFLFYFRL